MRRLRLSSLTALGPFQNEKRSSQRRSPLQDETPAAEDDYVDADMRADDESALKRIRQILADYAQEMNSYQPRGRRDRGRRSDGERAARRRPDRGEPTPAVCRDTLVERWPAV